jgi:sortase A
MTIAPPRGGASAPATETATAKPVKSKKRIALPRVVVSPTSRNPGGAASLALWFVVALCLLAVWSLLFAFVLTGYQQQRSQRILYAQFREQLSLATAPVGGMIHPSAPVAIMDIPAIGMNDEVIVEGTTPGDLENGPGHQRDTPLPGQAGTSIIMGRAVTFGGPFARISALRRGETIDVVTAQGQVEYAVTGVRHAGDPLPQPLASGHGRLTLVSADGSGWQSGWAPTHVVYVDASLAGRGLADTAGGPTTVTSAETSMASDYSALLPLVLLLQLLVIVATAISWSLSRWGAWQTWIVGLPAFVALLWAVSDAAVRLLPNLL